MTKELVVHDESTLSALEFYQIYKEEDSLEDLDIFKDVTNEEESLKELAHKSGTVKPTYRPIAEVNDVITEPAKGHEELVSCFRERLHVQSNLQYTSVDDQRALADVLIMAIISKWPSHRKLAPDPFLTDLGNVELKRRVAVCIIDTVERLFYEYVAKAEEWNAMQIFSTAANLSRLKTQLLQEADECLDLLKIRRKTVEEMRLKPKPGWLLEEDEALLLSALSATKEKTAQQTHQEMLERHLQELDGIPTLMDHHKVTEYDRLVRNFHEVAKNHQSDVPSEDLESVSRSSLTGEENVTSLAHTSNVYSDGEVDTNVQLYRSDSMPQLHDDTELHDEFKAVHDLPKRRLSVNQYLVNIVDDRPATKGKRLSAREDLANLVSSVTRGEKSGTLDDEFSPLLQVENARIRKKTRQVVLETEKLPDEETVNRAQSSKKDVLSDQPPILNVKVPKQGIVRINDVRVSTRCADSKLTLHKHSTIYNEFLNEIDEETVKSLDHHLYAGAEIRDVYNEITKTMTKSYLEFDQDDYVQDYAKELENTSQLFMSGLLQAKQYTRLVNDKLVMEKKPPWEFFSSADEWRNEPKFSGIGREDMLKINCKADLKSNRQSMFMGDATISTNGQLAKSYSSWLTWYRNNVNVDDYRKFLSTKESDFLCETFHLYDSDDGDEHRDEAARTSAQLLLLKQREEKRQKLLAEKNKYQKGYWNAQSVSLGGLGKDPSLPNVSAPDVEMENMKDEAAVYTCLQDRLEQIWKSLKMPEQQRLDMAVKHSGAQSLERLAQVVKCWGTASELIVSRENLMAKLEMFERTASDPNRFFEKGPNGSSVARMNESKVREKLNKQINCIDKDIIRMLDLIRKNFNDEVTYQGRNYTSKMQSDRIEMLYWLQQERRKANLDLAMNTNMIDQPQQKMYQLNITPII